MNMLARQGTAMWVQNVDGGDIYYRVKTVFERQPDAIERCALCHRGDLSHIGHVIQTGQLDDSVWSITMCNHCCGIVVFMYHVPHVDRLLPEPGDCHDLLI